MHTHRESERDFVRCQRMYNTSKFIHTASISFAAYLIGRSSMKHKCVCTTSTLTVYVECWMRLSKRRIVRSGDVLCIQCTQHKSLNDASFFLKSSFFLFLFFKHILDGVFTYTKQSWPNSMSPRKRNRRNLFTLSDFGDIGTRFLFSIRFVPVFASTHQQDDHIY